MFSGCYFSATGETDDRQAFVHSVLKKLVEQESEISWTHEAIVEDEKYQFYANLFALAGLLSVHRSTGHAGHQLPLAGPLDPLIALPASVVNRVALENFNDLPKFNARGVDTNHTGYSKCALRAVERWYWGVRFGSAGSLPVRMGNNIALPNARFPAGNGLR